MQRVSIFFLMVVSVMFLPGFAQAKVIEKEKEIREQIELLKDMDKNVRDEAIDTLVSSGKPVVPFLIEALESIRNIDTGVPGVATGWFFPYKNSIVFVLGKIKDESAIQNLYKLIRDEDIEVASYAVEALCLAQDETIVFDLMKTAEIIHRNIKPPVEKKAIVDMDDEQSMELEHDYMLPVSIEMGIGNVAGNILPILIKALDHQDWEIRFFAVRVLANKMKELRKMQVLIPLFIDKLDDANPEVRKAVKSALDVLTDVKYKTGKGLGMEKKPWQIWWEKYKKEY